MTLSLIAEKTGPVTSRPPSHVMEEGKEPMDLGFMIGASISATHTFEDAPALDILLVPGGIGNVSAIKLRFFCTLYSQSRPPLPLIVLNSC